ncbi:23S rRNA (guanosine-2'-O-) -methyltransferase rlmB [Sulfuriferula multivorans]|uniref:23S rRNA (Guanosine-2'-O-)-methyltransferase rlmB n=1 Tax=Sulfuriferula multivorans TaxID=1559896 RepID=A0A401JG36_9PROT|nr:RNA methyltransferase [Sulfuriferula multivorans]GBL46572.1 23S rRNA (guanosine-2'-O-) -methyltransferase rlmB [Sulfuriferula multivorans]
MTETISSPQNPRFKHVKKLAESAAVRHEYGQTLLDGEHLLTAALEAGIRPALLITTAAASASSLLQDCAEVERLTLSQALFNVLSPVKAPTGILALITIPQSAPPSKTNFCVLLEAIQDPGNLGAMLRSAAAAGVDVVYLSSGCADAWSPKVLRGGMGAHFATHIIENADLPAVAQAFPGAVCAATLGAAHSLYQTDLRGAVAFAVGNEGAGLSAELRAAAGVEFTIPMPGTVESLNAAAALAVCLFERVRQAG